MLGAIGLVHLAGGFFAPSGIEFPLALLGAAITLAIGGAGRFSLDALIARRRVAATTDAAATPPPIAKAAWASRLRHAWKIVLPTGSSHQDLLSVGPPGPTTAPVRFAGSAPARSRARTRTTADPSNQKWERLHESRAKDIVVTWPDGHETKGIDVHIEGLKAMFVYAPDIEIKVHQFADLAGLRMVTAR